MTLNPLNPAAGDVPVPEDAREVAAAIRACPITHRIFPYIDLRYGERGRKFSQSDSAWLAWLVRYDQAHVNDQIFWLRSVLSNRGMPGWILEVHLVALHKQLVRSVPEKEAEYKKLLVTADMLRSQRRKVLPDQTWNNLAANFANALPGKSSIAFGVGRLLVAAAMDERLGVKNAVSSFEKWFADIDGLRELEGVRQFLPREQLRALDSDGFAAVWQESFRSTIAKVRKATNG